MFGLMRAVPFLVACTAGVGVLIAGPAAARDLKAPEGPVILEVDGAIERRNDGDSAVFDRRMLQALGESEIVTSTPWTDGVKTFRGVPAAAVMESVGADGDSVSAQALNDYSVVIPFEDFARYGVLLAMEMDGKRLSVREKGPIWIIYPRDDYSELQDAKIDSRWIWQLKRLSVK